MIDLKDRNLEAMSRALHECLCLKEDFSSPTLNEDTQCASSELRYDQRRALEAENRLLVVFKDPSLSHDDGNR